MLLLPGTGRNFVPLQERYRTWLGDEADGWGLAWLRRVRDRMGDRGHGLDSPLPPVEVWTRAPWEGEYSNLNMVRTLRKFIQFLEANRDIRRRLFT